MKSRAYTFVGGTQHGIKRAVQYDARYFSFPCYDMEKGYREERYEQRRVILSGCVATVVALEGMGEGEFNRRVADILEGV